MDDARNLQYGIGFDTADAETSVENPVSYTHLTLPTNYSV